MEQNRAVYEENNGEEIKVVSAKPRRSFSGTAGRILGAVGTLLMLIVVLACLFLIIPKFAGYDGYVVVSGSMEPTIPVGSIVYSKNEDPSTMNVGDVIVFLNEAQGRAPITHRIVSNDTVTGTIITKGDANESEDIHPVPYNKVLGRVEAHVPRIGFTVAMFTTTLGKIIALLLLTEGWLLIEIGRRMRAMRR